MTAGTIEYRGSTYITMPLEVAVTVYDERAAKGEHVAVIDASAHGGKNGEYFIVPAKVREGANGDAEQLED